MSDKEQLQALIKNISEGLKKFSIGELNVAIIQLLNKKGGRNQEVNFILNEVCKLYSITRRTLIYSKEHGSITEARTLSYALLQDCVGLTQRHIAKRVFNKDSRTVNRAIAYARGLNMEIKTDREFKNKYDSINIKFVESIKETNK